VALPLEHELRSNVLELGFRIEGLALLDANVQACQDFLRHGASLAGLDDFTCHEKNVSFLQWYEELTEH